MLRNALTPFRSGQPARVGSLVGLKPSRATHPRWLALAISRRGTASYYIWVGTGPRPMAGPWMGTPRTPREARVPQCTPDMAFWAYPQYWRPTGGLPNTL